MKKINRVSGNGRSVCRRGLAGFTLVELMVVIVIVGLLAAISIPSYRNYVVRGQRTDGKAALIDLQARQERFYFNANTYTVTLSDLSYPAPATSREEHFTLTIAAPTTGCPINSCWEATATRQVATADTDCNQLTLNSLGLRSSQTASNTPSPAAANCWGR